MELYKFIMWLVIECVAIFFTLMSIPFSLIMAWVWLFVALFSVGAIIMNVYKNFKNQNTRR